MAIRDKMRARCQPFLEPGEQVQQVWMSQTGGNPWMLMLTNLMLFFFSFRIICVTDRAIVVFKASRWYAKPQGVLVRLPRNILFGPMRGVWGSTEATGEKIYVHRRFHKDVAAADAAISARGYGYAGRPAASVAPTATDAAAAAATPAGWYADPNAAGTMRWYDGTRWTEHVQAAQSG